ncbi:MAG: alanyl-tRNA editing protein [Anaerolineales bacterium]|nr:alanyl-tRNA editing protein [Anaerolineales bacterium]
MTKLLYHQDAYLNKFESKVQKSDKDAVVVDQTAFFPGGGGQPYDVGEFRAEDNVWEVNKVRRKDGELWHFLDEDAPVVGTILVGEIDWERRFQLMRTHTAMHILCGVIWRDYQASVTGGNMEPLRGRMDFEFETMRRELVDEIQKKINFEVEASREVTTRVLPREQAFQIPDLIRTKINLLPEGIEEVRIVEIMGLDLQADGGTHVSNTQEVGTIKIVDYKSKGAINKRIVVSLEP